MSIHVMVLSFLIILVVSLTLIVPHFRRNNHQANQKLKMLSASLVMTIGLSAIFNNLGQTHAMGNYILPIALMLAGILLAIQEV